jgi:2-dehydro-3-deoxy-D-arabinonate dehydratase
VEAPLSASLADLLALPLEKARSLVESATDWRPATHDAQLLPPLDRFPELVDCLFRAMDFPAGVVLLTGTGVVPGGDFTLREGDHVVVDVSEVGVLANPVTVVGR